MVTVKLVFDETYSYILVAERLRWFL